MTKIITYGTFDVLHEGHINILKRAKALGDYLIVAVATDEFNQIKGKKALYGFEKRKAMVEELEYVDEVIAEHNWEQKEKDIKKYGIDIFVMGDDWEGQFDFLNGLCIVAYFPRTKYISSTMIREELNKIGGGNK